MDLLKHDLKEMVRKVGIKQVIGLFILQMILESFFKSRGRFFKTFILPSVPILALYMFQRLKLKLGHQNPNMLKKLNDIEQYLFPK